MADPTLKLSPCDFLLRKYLESKVNANEHNSTVELKNEIQPVIGQFDSTIRKAVTVNFNKKLDPAPKHVWSIHRHHLPSPMST